MIVSKPRLSIALLIAIAAACVSNTAEGRPNVVLIVSDDQRWTDFGFMDHEVIRTPNLDRLAAESAVFPNGYVPTSLCRASLATLLTGLFAHEHRICCNDPPQGVDRAVMLPFLREAPTVPRILGEAGYRSLQTGKFWEGHYSNGGFTHGMTTKGRHGEEGLAIGRETMQPIYDFVNESGETPFFIWYAPMLPHTPHNPPERILEKYTQGDRPPKLATYYAMCEWFDETCGNLLDFIDEKGLKGKTIVIFVVDNGWIQETEEQRSTRGWFAPKSKMSPYDGGVRTPVMIRWPGKTKPGRYDDLVSSTDLAPTILKACGLEPTPRMSGLDLLPRASGGEPLPREQVFGEIYFHDVRDLNHLPVSLTFRWIRRGEWKLILPADSDQPPELYHLEKDPDEENNVADAHAEKVAKLTAELNEWWTW